MMVCFFLELFFLDEIRKEIIMSYISLICLAYFASCTDTDDKCYTSIISIRLQFCFSSMNLRQFSDM
jgi:hypothetical protein